VVLMAVTAASVIRRAVDTLQDPVSVRWPVAELVRYLNDGQREVVMHRPDSTATTASVSLVPGARQQIPAGGAKLLEVVRNGAGAKRAVSVCDKELLDAQVPGWHVAPGATEAVHFMFDPRDPRSFHVYPPALVGASLELVYAAIPTLIAEPASPSATHADVVGNIALPDIYANALLDYVLFRAFSKDAEFAGVMARAQAHYSAFAQALGVELRSTALAGPAPSAGAASRRVASVVAGGST
jgi:hypothetical protein